MGRFINADGAMGVSSDLNTYNLFAYCGNNPVARCDSSGCWWIELACIHIHMLNNIAVAIGIDTAALGAQSLDMEADDAGVYHAKFDCWQQYFGYNILYDVAFDMGTSMETARFSFTFSRNTYTIWAWKGNYINLGAGAELGIYRGGGAFVSAYKHLAIKMSMGVACEGKQIIYYAPQERQWWITGFNPNYPNRFAWQLTACFVLTFHNRGMYLALKNEVLDDGRWTFYDQLNTAVFTF
jgi:hypothetical protein